MSAGYHYKPSKPAAVLGVFLGVGMIVVVVTTFDWGGRNTPFIAFWCVAVVAITSLNVWAAFAKNGSLGVFGPRRGPHRD